jgi:hypothetical protein
MNPMPPDRSDEVHPRHNSSVVGSIPIGPKKQLGLELDTHATKEK